MKISIDKLKEELEELPPRIEAMLEIIEKEILIGEDIYLVDLIVSIIHRADKIPAKYMIDLMTLWWSPRTNF